MKVFILDGPFIFHTFWKNSLISLKEFQFHDYKTNNNNMFIPILCCCSANQLCLTLRDPIDCSMPGFPVLHRPLNSAQSHVYWVQSKHLIFCHPFSSCPQTFPTSGSFPVGWLFASGGQSIGASASASVLPMNNQNWFPLGLNGLISLQSKGLSRVFSSTTVENYQLFSILTFFMVQLSHLYMTTGKTIALTT